MTEEEAAPGAGEGYDDKVFMVCGCRHYDNCRLCGREWRQRSVEGKRK